MAFSDADADSKLIVQGELGAELLKLHEASYGKGASTARVLVEDDVIVLLLDGLELLPNEEFLVENGHAASVVAVRSEYQQAIEPVFRAAVERVTGRRVVSFASITKLEPNYAVEIFRLGPVLPPRDDGR